MKRIVYSPGNRTPIAAATATPVSGDAPLRVAFDARGSSDPDGDALIFRWDFGDASAFEWRVTLHHNDHLHPHHPTRRGDYRDLPDARRP